MLKVFEIKEIKIEEIVTLIRRGRILVLPTDTVYGLVCDASNKRAVEKIYKIKKRPKSKPLPVFVKDLNMAKKLAEISKKQEIILKKYWPGKYTFVLERKNDPKGTSKLYGVNKKTIALRIPKYKFLNDLLKKAKKPLVQTSVNISSQPVLVKIEEIIHTFSNKKNKPDLIINAGDLSEAKPSTIIDLANKNIKILRK